tara:strand:+ start:3438 stop:4484 length:1047 start_codon:yes stop_codon:yes gene_type:complete
MNSKNSLKLPLDRFIDLSLYDKKMGYYMKKNPFGKEGDFITAPNVSRMFSEIIAIWIVGLWENLGSPRKFNLVELGAGNGSMMKILIESFKNFPNFLKTCNIIIHEKSPKMIKIQKKELKLKKITWTPEIKKIRKAPTIFIANEFFDSIPIKQFIKKKNLWFEKYVKIKKNKNGVFFNKKFNMKKFEKKINYNISKNQDFIEYSLQGLKYLKNISKFIKRNNGGILIIDYGYLEKKMKNTLRAISNHQYSNILDNIGKSDITHTINFYLYKKLTQQLGGVDSIITTQRDFLLKMGIEKRAEVITKNQNFSKKADIYYRLKKLIDENEMGRIFKVMFIKKQKNNYRLGF